MTTAGVQVKNLKKSMLILKRRFEKLQRSIVGEAAFEAAQPIIVAAKAMAPENLNRIGNRYRAYKPAHVKERIGIAPKKKRSGGRFQDFGIGPVRLSKGDKRFPFWGLMQETGWTHHPWGRQGITVQMAGKHYLKKAGEQHWQEAHRIFAQRVIKSFEEVRDAAAASGFIVPGFSK